MPHIVLTEEQARIVERTTLAIEVRAPDGHVIGVIPPPSDAEVVARVKRNRRAPGPTYPMEEVRARLLKLEEISHREELDEAKVKDLLRRMRAGEEV